MLPRTILKSPLTFAALLFLIAEAAACTCVDRRPLMVRSIQILAIGLLLMLASVAGAQTPLTTCATVEVDGPSEVDPGTPVAFNAKITGPIQTTKPEFKWLVSAGTRRKSSKRRR